LAVFNLACTGGGDGGGSPKALSEEDTFYVQLTGVLRTDVPATVYEVDLFETPRETVEELKRRGKKDICYFSAGTLEPRRGTLSARGGGKAAGGLGGGILARLSPS